MKRDWDIIRTILVRVEEISPDEGALQLSAFAPEQAASVSYHMELLIEAGLVSGKMSKTLGPGPYNFIVMRLTWQGHEFIDAIRNDTVWQKTKKSFLTNGISMTFDLVKSVATDIASAYIKAVVSG
jgi:hypothetical protein